MKRRYLFSLVLVFFAVLACQSTSNTPAASQDSSTRTPEVATQTPEPTLQPTAVPITEITDDFGVPMMFVPEGEFTMGVEPPPTGGPYDNTLHMVYLDSYYIDKYEVTNAYYAVCVSAGVCDLPYRFYSKTHENYYRNSEFDDYPVIALDYEKAKVYCIWRDAQLPTEAQWEKAARGIDERNYPWGNRNSDNTLANFDSINGDTMPVGSYPMGASPYGVMDMAGNVWEWVADNYSIDYYQNSPYNNPAAPSTGINPVVRGGAWDTYWNQIQVYERWINPVGLFYTVGFRCAKNISP